MTMQLPKYELYESGSQIRRASKSVSANLVEGYGRRRYPNDYVRFLIIARASADETLEFLHLLHDCGSLEEDTYERLTAGYNEVGRMLTGLIRSTTNRPSNQPPPHPSPNS